VPLKVSYTAIFAVSEIEAIPKFKVGHVAVPPEAARPRQLEVITIESAFHVGVTDEETHV